MPVVIDDRQDIVAIEPRLLDLLKRSVILALGQEDLGEEVEVSVLLSDDDYIRGLNSAYRGLDESTDVLAFALREDSGEEPCFNLEDGPGEELLGDVVISVETARRQAGEHGYSLERELVLLLVHGVLHLLGFDHDSPDRERVMWEKTDHVLSALGLRA